MSNKKYDENIVSWNGEEEIQMREDGKREQRTSIDEDEC